MNLSKSRYTKGIQCPKMLWMDANMPEQFDPSVMNQAVLDNGSLVGDVAMGYYGDYVEVPFDPEVRDYERMVEFTREHLAKGTPVICEATFAYRGCLCMADILRVEPDGVHMVEVKSSTSINPIYYHDMAFQVWVLRHCGVNVKSVSLMHLNGQYVRHGDLDLHQLFTVEDCTAEVMDMQDGVQENIPLLQAVPEQESEPAMGIGCQCKKPYECGYRGWCWRHLPKPSVFDLNGIHTTKALELLGEGIVTLGDILEADEVGSSDSGEVTVKLNRRQKVQAMCEARGYNGIVDRDDVAAFLDTLRFPLYFLDFETYQPAIPPYDGVKPYQQIPTQYSLHILAAPGAELEHREFLAQAGTDPRRSVAEHLVEDIPEDACTLAYNMSFENGRIRELAEAFPDLSEHLLGISRGMCDLIVPFKKGLYYVRAMGGSNSIKYVLPALFPNDPELDYHSLEGVHNGSEAMAAFSDLEGMEPEQAAKVRENLLRYCELDTYAMVKIWQNLVEVAGIRQGSD